MKVGHEKYQSHLVIPYLRPAGPEYTATVRFRCIRDECVKDSDGTYLFLKGLKERHEKHGKYQSLPADHPRLYNTTAMNRSDVSYIAITEGEFSSWAVEMDGIPAVAVQGVSAWKDHFDRAFAGYERVFILGDGDEAGEKFNEKMSERLSNGVPITLPEGEDPDSLRRQYGDGIIRQMLGLAE